MRLDRFGVFLLLLLPCCGSAAGKANIAVGGVAGSGDASAGTSGTGTSGAGTSGTGTSGADTSGSAGDGSAGAPVAAPMVISPPTAHVAPAGMVTFTATVTAAPTTPIVWSVQEGMSGGAVSAAGLYTAPANAGTYHVVATSSADPKLTASAIVTVAVPRSCTMVPAAGAWDSSSISPVVATPGQPSYEFVGKSNALIIDPFDSSTVWLGTGQKGLYKSADCGGSWNKVNTGTNGDAIDRSVLWSMILDPMNQGVMYVVAAYGAGGLFKSIDSGKSWVQLLPPSSEFAKAKSDNFVNNVSMDPSNPLHLVIASHGTCAAPNAHGCFTETFNGGMSWSPLVQMPSPWGEKGGVQVINATTWIWGTGDGVDGMYVTTNNGKTWTHPLLARAGDAAGEFSTQPLTKASDGAYYIASLDGVLRSTDGVAWTRAWDQKDFKSASVLAATVSETTIFASNGTNFYSAPLKDYTNWAAMNGPAGNTDSATFLAYDPSHHLLYASCWGGGVFRYTPPN